MNYDKNKIRQYLITDYLTGLGIESVNQEGTRLQYFSPFRNETTPSFWVHLEENKWKDFGLGEKGGDIIELVQRIEKLDFKKALERIHFLINSTQVQQIFERESAYVEKPKRKAMVLNFRALEYQPLIDYCMTRGISERVSKTYLYQIQYLNQYDHKYLGVGMVNVKGGYEIRTFNFKLCLGEKTYTQLTQRPFSKRVMVFEGMFDFLSLMQLKKIYNFSDIGANIIVLHSVSNISHIDLQNYDSIDLFLDNDEAGTKATEKLFEHYSDKQVSDFSKAMYPNHKDLNDFLLCRAKPQK